MDKTNVCRILDQKKIEYTLIEYDETFTDGVSIAETLNEDVHQVFKTLVTIGNDNNHYVFCVPVIETLNLKKAAKVVGVKSIEMIKQKELLPLTGYIHGGCSPIGMKKPFKTIINNTCLNYDYIFVSAGKCGKQIKINPNDLVKTFNLRLEDII